MASTTEAVNNRFFKTFLLFATCFAVANVNAQDLIKEQTGITVLFQTSWSQPNIHYNAGGAWTTLPGVPMKPASFDDEFTAKNGWFQFDVKASQLEFVFNDGNGVWNNNNDKNYKIVKDGAYIVEAANTGRTGPQLVKPDDGSGNVVILFQTKVWPSPHIHYNNGVSWTSPPGTPMEPSTQSGRYSAVNGWFQIAIKAAKVEFVFNDGSSVWDNNKDQNYKVDKAGTWAVVSQVNTLPPPPQGYVNGPGYSVTSVSENGDRLSISLSVNPSSQDAVYGADLKDLVVDVFKGQNDYVRVKITDKSAKRWEVPSELYKKGALGNAAKTQAGGQTNADQLYDFSYTRNPFTFKVTRKSDNYVLFDSSKLSLVYKNQYLQVATAVPSDLNVYGLGESTRNSMRVATGAKNTLWARDQASFVPNVNLYGAHPFFMGVNGKGQAHGVLLLNSNGMDITLEKDMLVYQPIGGILDFHIVVGPTPAKVMSQYTSLIGKPKLQPYWSFGFHQCRWGYPTIGSIREVVDKYAEQNIPLDTIWADIDYMDKFYDFTLDPVKWPQSEVLKFISDLKKKKQHIVPIVDPGIPDDVKDLAYTRGLEYDVFIKDRTGKPYLGQVWPGPTVFPSFFHPNVTEYWYEQMDRFYDLMPFDGLWIDMNEIANFCPGTSCKRKPGVQCPVFGSIAQITTCCLECVADRNGLDNPPFAINNVNSKDAIFNKAISTNSLHFSGILEYDVHNLYGFTESIVTDDVQERLIKKRSFVLSRSTFPGAGAYAAHWTGDNAATWNDLKWSIPAILNMGVYGIPMIGADICGFAGPTSEELCGRWHQLGAFYPFSRNHNNLESPPQEPYMWSSVAAITRKFVGLRYQLLPYFYSAGYESSVNGVPIARALFFEFPEDANCRSGPALDRQFLIGSGLLVTPVLDQGATSVQGYLPAGTWYNIFDGSRTVSKGETFTWSAKFDEMPVHIRGGTIIPMHQAGTMTTAEARETPFDIVVALPAGTDAKASGNLFLDDGEEINVGERATVVEFAASAGSFTSKTTMNKYADASTKKVKTVVVWGVSSEPKSVSVNGLDVPVVYKSNLQRLDVEIPKSLALDVTSELVVNWK
jgi:alpha-D-xyloside xylohydrolase